MTQILRDSRLTQTIQSGAASHPNETLSDLNAAQLLNAADIAGVTAQAADAGVNRLAIFELARRLKQSEMTDFDQAMKELSAAVDVAIDVAKQGRGGNLDNLVKNVLAAVAEKTKAGDFDGAAQEADRGFAEWERAEADRHQAALQSGVAILEAGLEQDILRRDAVAAAKRVQRIVVLEHSKDSDAQFNAIRTRKDDFYVHGRDQGINFDLMIAIELARLTLKIATNSDQRGAAWNDLATAHNVLGQRENGTARLQEAVEAYRAALQEQTRERVPLDWAGIQNNLGAALRALGERENGTTRLQEAVEAYRAALLKMTRERVPLDWAMTQSNLGNSLRALGACETGSERLQEALKVFRTALLERTRERAPLEWANTQNNLGVALQTLGERENGTERLQEAIAAFRAALLERTRERVPLDWAITQNNLGNALQALGERESGTERLQEAVKAFRAALEVIEDSKASYYIEVTRSNLAHAEWFLAERRKPSSPATSERK